MFCDFALLADLDPTGYYPWIGLGAFALFFALSLLVVVIDEEKRISVSMLQFILAHLSFVPVAAYLTVWCYQHPDRLANNPDAWMDDMRPVWPFFALFDVGLIAWFIRGRRNWEAKALRLMKRARRLQAEGKTEEAGVAYAEARSILDHKCKRN